MKKNRFTSFIREMDKSNNLVVSKKDNRYFITNGFIAVIVNESVYDCFFAMEKAYYKQLEDNQGYSLPKQQRKALEAPHINPDGMNFESYLDIPCDCKIELTAVHYNQMEVAVCNDIYSDEKLISLYNEKYTAILRDISGAEYDPYITIYSEKRYGAAYIDDDIGTRYIVLPIRVDPRIKMRFDVIAKCNA